MSLDERLIDQHDPQRDQRADLQRAIKQTLHYIMGLASVAELFGLQAYLSKLASQMAPVHAERFGTLEMPEALRQQMAEIERHNAALQAQMVQANCTSAPYRQGG